MYGKSSMQLYLYRTQFTTRKKEEVESVLFMSLILCTTVGPKSLNSPSTTILPALWISMDPLAMKYNEVSTSPRWTRISPGGAWVVLNLRENALQVQVLVHFPYCLAWTQTHRRQPGLASEKAAHVVSSFLFKCRQMSACRHSGNPLSSEFMSMPFVSERAVDY